MMSQIVTHMSQVMVTQSCITKNIGEDSETNDVI